MNETESSESPQQTPEPTDGRVHAVGSVWKIHYETATLDEFAVAQALKALGVVKVEQVVTTGVARVTPTIR